MFRSERIYMARQISRYISVPLAPQFAGATRGEFNSTTARAPGQGTKPSTSPKIDTAGEINICLDIGQPVGPRAAKREHRVAANGTPCHQLTKRT
ncbi:hypothetical protein, partial [Moorena sp. SIO4A5]